MKLLALLLLLPTALFAQDDAFEDDWGDEWNTDEASSAWSGFAEVGLGTRLGADPSLDSDSTLEDIRLRVESEWQAKSISIGFKADVGYDGVENGATGDVRDLTAAFTVGKSMDFKIGRQVQTWGTGDLVFLNDLFPKDFVSFFAGRDDEYLKAPGNTIRVTRFSKTLNIDAVWTPVFEPDVYLTGERFSFFSPLSGGNVAPNPPLSALKPSKSLSNGELALRLFRTVEGREYALYVYHGFFKQPTALTPALEATFAPLTAIGASVRRPMGPGLLNAEASFYVSRDDRSGANPLLPNDQFRFLFGYEWEAKPRFTVGLQYYLESTLDHDELIANSPFPEFEPDEFRHLLTNRLTYRTPRDRHTFSLFTFLSPSDQDIYLRPVYTYRHSDQWSVVAGGNLFGGDERHTFFKQLSDASNAYARVRFIY